MYKLNNQIRIGDIILVRGAAKHSKVIAEFTKGHFSHAMIALENGVFLEAITGSGVQRTSSLRVLFQDKSNVIVLRCNFPNKVVEQRVLTFISVNSPKYQGQKYSFNGAIQSIKSNVKIQNIEGYFCSHLIASIYADAGFPLFEELPHKITPNGLLESKFLNDITEDVIITASNTNNLNFECIDAGGTTLSQDAKNHRQFLNKTAKYFRRNGLNIPNNVPDIILILIDKLDRENARKLDYQISKVYKAIGINEYISKNIYHPDISLLISEVMNKIDIYGEAYILPSYQKYSYDLVLTLSKRYLILKHQEISKLCYQTYKFRFFELRFEYYTILADTINSLIDDARDVLKNFEKNFPQYLNEFQNIIYTVSQEVIEKQNDPEVRSALITSLNNMNK